MSKRAEEKALEAYPVKMTPLVHQDLIDSFGGKTEIDTNAYLRLVFQEGYEQAEEEIEKRIMKYLDGRNDSDYATVGRIKKHFEEYKKVIMKDSNE